MCPEGFEELVHEGIAIEELGLTADFFSIAFLGLQAEASTTLASAVSSLNFLTASLAAR